MFPCGSDGKESFCKDVDSGDPGLIPGLGRSPGEGSRSPLQYSCLEYFMDRGAWGRKESDMTEQLHALSFMLLVPRDISKEEPVLWVFFA